MSGRPPTEVTAKLCVTPLRRPSRPVSREAREGEQVEAAAWKSTNLHGKKRDWGPSIHREPKQEKFSSHPVPRIPGLGKAGRPPLEGPG